jgi:hypothetical protein
MSVHRLLEEKGYIVVLDAIANDMATWIDNDVATKDQTKWQATQDKLVEVIADLRKLGEF